MPPTPSDEILTARRCFAGDTVSDTLASVLKEDPDWSQLPAGTPPPVRRLLRRCLAKDPRQRLSDAADARLELREAFETHEGFETATERAGVATPPSMLPWVVAAVAALIAVAALGLAWLGDVSPTGAGSFFLPTAC